MATEALIGYGSQVLIADEAGTNYTKIAEVISIDLPSPQVGVEEATNMDSADALSEDISGIATNQNITVEMNWIPSDPTQDSSDDGLEGLILARASRNLRFIAPDDAQTTMTQLVRFISFNKKIDVKSKMTATLVVRPSGLPVWS